MGWKEGAKDKCRIQTLALGFDMAAFGLIYCTFLDRCAMIRNTETKQIRYFYEHDNRPRKTFYEYGH